MGRIAPKTRRSHTLAMESTDVSQPAVNRPIVIYRTANRDGETFAIDPLCRERLRERFGDVFRSRQRVFIAHETRADYEHVHGQIVPQIVVLLTGLSEERLNEVGPVIFVDAVTERELPRK